MESEISIDKLNKISKELSNMFFPYATVYHLLSLSLITVTKYSDDVSHLPTKTRVDLSILYLPELIISLTQNKVITDGIADELLNKLKIINDDIPLILEAYLYVAGGVNTEVKIKSKPSKRCGILN